jgi:flagellar L-ring protein precursor FlgH
MKPIRRKSLTYFTLAFLLATSSWAAKNKKDKHDEDMAADKLARYIERVRATTAPSPTLGSIWVAQGRFSDLAGDDKARNVNDTIIINVVEQTTAVGDAAVKSQRTFSASSGISALWGIPRATSGLQNIFSPQSSQVLNGQAQTASDSSFTTSLSAQVVSVLPNGFLVIEAVRQMEMNNQRQTLVVHGVVRPSDIAPDNSVLSSQISYLEIGLKGKGVLSDGVRPPNKIIRAILSLVGF